MDRMRESVFAVLGDLTDRSFLDLFSGSGVVGIEAASRGAWPVVLVEKDARKIGTLKRNVSFVTNPVEVRLSPAERYVKKAGRSFDCIFLDPPFRYPAKAALFSLIAAHGVLSEDGLILIHLPKAEARDLTVTDFELRDERRYGNSHVIFYGKKAVSFRG